MTETHPTRLLAIGPFPPPVHGQSIATEHFVRAFVDNGWTVDRVDVNGSLPRKVARHLLGLLQILGGSAPCYVSLNSNAGIWLSLALVAAARLRRRFTLLHYHSYALVQPRTLSVSLLSRLSGPRSRHIVLGRRMETSLHELYPHLHDRVVVLNNSGLIEAPLSPRSRKRGQGLTLGFLGNLTLEKGIDSAVEVTRRLLEDGEDCRLVVAGPVSSPGADKVLSSARAVLGDNLIYKGAVYGSAKKQFFEEIDILVFPSRYRNEASPLVLMEAMANAIPCVATAIGCIPDDLADKGGVAVQDFGAEAPAAIRSIASALDCHSAHALDRFRELLEDYKEGIKSLRVLMASDGMIE